VNFGDVDETRADTAARVSSTSPKFTEIQKASAAAMFQDHPFLPTAISARK
jgi:hypothetical protein